jgi:hypothetical protein
MSVGIKAEETALSGILQQSGVHVDENSIDRLVAFDEDDHDVNATAAMFSVCLFACISRAKTSRLVMCVCVCVFQSRCMH